MSKKILIIFLLFFSILGFSDSQYNKRIVVKKQSRDDKVIAVFNNMMQAYEEKNLNRFFSYVSEDKFIQDYMTFYDAIEKDMRTYDINNIDTWINKITKDGAKRYLYVRWDKRYQSINSDVELEKKGFSRFLFDEINGKYKLIGLAGNNFWGDSLAEWKEEVPQIAGQEVYNNLPDFTIGNFDASSFEIKNIGKDDYSGPIEWKVYCDGSVQDSGTYASGLAAGSSADINYNITGSCTSAPIVKVDPDNLIQESDESNNIKQATAF